jgi:glycosyltransferase involved in cell wall biosynthesis
MKKNLQLHKMKNKQQSHTVISKQIDAKTAVNNRDISIITPSYNQANFLEQTIQSVVNRVEELTELYPNITVEYIIKDGLSSDDSVKIIQKFAQKYSYISWTSKKDAGQSDAIHSAIMQAKGSLICWINSDDLYTPLALVHIYQLWTKKQQPVMYWSTGLSKIVDQDTNTSIFYRYIESIKYVLLRLMTKQSLTIVNSISQPSVTFTKELYLKAGGLTLSLHYCMDYDLWLRFYQIVPPTKLYKTITCFRRHKTSKSVSRVDAQFQEQYAVAKNYTQNILVLTIHKIVTLVTISTYKLFKE